MPGSEFELDQKLPVGILGATGIVGQRMAALLEGHPWFELKVVGASNASVGKRYGNVKWRIDNPSFVPDAASRLEVVSCDLENFQNCAWVFSALDSSVAQEIEPRFQQAVIPIFTNSSAFRMDPTVPLIVPTANGLDFVKLLRTDPKGLLVANSNCTTSGIAVVLAAFVKAGLELDAVTIHSLQAVSGAGVSPGLSVMDIHDNVVPYISEEEPKIEEEIRKILGFDDLKVSASCNRVMVTDGHTVNLAVKFKSTLNKSLLVTKSKKALTDYSVGIKQLPTMPKTAIFLFDETTNDRPQPKLDRMREGGMCTSVGRLRECPVMDIKLTLLLHNTILGAAGSALLNAELAFSEGMIKA
ncbi:Aspartate-semialdehyde dehydrogenase [Paramicrosporidium saccamoebae]|uniref:Aspartate-semialdehyde dehydrogenase n=1 Tax=Paramicrosporidium saccamoebae TaxID=1246581 RepID=A0A2H9TMA2_9FUNG|nr:Aspartate-semialdehyde dehydrogenase [Paramicrosporidium saccamoebae]